MKVSQKAEYALRAMLELAVQNDQRQPVRTADIARQQRIPEKFLELILVELRRAGLVKSQRGPVGGHRLARTPDEITVGDIWRTIDGSLTDGQETALPNDAFKAVWKDVEQAINKVVNNVTLAEIRRRTEARRGVADYSI